MKTEIAILNYGVGNLHSVARACKNFSAEVKIVEKPRDISTSTHLIFPGVGTFGVAMSEISARGLADAINQHVYSGKPVLGICVGMQIFAQTGTENGHHKGLGFIQGEVIEIDKFPGAENIQKPNMGWSDLSICNEAKSNKLMKDIDATSSVYFAHSYAIKVNQNDFVTSKITIGKAEIPASVEMQNIYGVQFHPEKSGEVGLQVIKRFLSLESAT